MMPKRPLPAPGVLGEVYLIHLDKPLGHAQHYIGYSAELLTRERRHAAGNGARLLAVAKARGITWQVVRTWPGAGRRFERRLKNTANARKLCPECNPDGWDRQMTEPGDPKPRKSNRQEK